MPKNTTFCRNEASKAFCAKIADAGNSIANKNINTQTPRLREKRFIADNIKAATALHLNAIAAVKKLIK